jgi:hypothetical protein
MRGDDLLSLFLSTVGGKILAFGQVCIFTLQHFGGSGSVQN